MSFSFSIFFFSVEYSEGFLQSSSSPSVYYFVMSKLIFNPQINFLNFNDYIFFISMSSIWVFFNLFGLSNILSFDYVFIPSVISLSYLIYYLLPILQNLEALVQPVLVSSNLACVDLLPCVFIVNTC